MRDAIAAVNRPDRFVADKERRRFERAVRGAATFEEMPDRYRQLPGGAASFPALLQQRSLNDGLACLRTRPSLCYRALLSAGTAEAGDRAWPACEK